MNFIYIILVNICLSANASDTTFMVRSKTDTVYITSNDIVRVDTFGLFELTFHLSKEMCDFLNTMNYNSCQIYYHLRNKSWIILQEYEMRTARIPEGYSITTDFGKIVRKDCINIGYNYPDKIKKRRNYRKKYMIQPVFWD